jgi:hypothetical protein
MLWAAILLAWELIGGDLAKIQASGGNIGAVITAIKSPQAIPWVLLLLVAYFLFKTTVEWMQSNQSRRQLRVARIDFFSAIFFAVVSYLLYFGQRIARVQFADLLAGRASYFFSAVAGPPLGLALIRLALKIRDTFVVQDKTWVLMRLGIEQFAVLSTVSFAALSLSRWAIGRISIAAFLVGALILPAFGASILLADILISFISGRPRFISRE